MWRNLKREFGYYKQDMRALWIGNNDLFDYLVKGPLLTILVFPAHVLGFVLAGIGYYSLIESR
jgi:hypothetical protein